MRKAFLTIVALLIMMPSAVQAQSAKAAKLDSIANKLFDEENYGKSLEIRQKHLAALKEEVGEGDSTYIASLIQLGKCYYRTKQLDQALKTAQQVVDLYGKHINTTDKTYAFALDNLALYQSAAEKYPEGLANAQKALAVYQNFHENDRDMAVIQLHVAELAHFSGDNNKAIHHELLALNILKNLYGEHSNQYIEEAEYLCKYYEENGDKAKAKELAERLETLKKETEDGELDLPQPVEFTSAAVAHAHNRDAARCIEYLLNHYITDPKINDAASYIMNWSQATGDSHVVIGENEAKLMNNEKSMAYFVAYIAGCSKYALATGKADFSLDTFKDAMVDVLNYYQANKQYTGEVKYLEQYIKAHDKSREKLDALLEKNFPGKLNGEMIDRIKKGENVKLEK
ncbi:lipopolysaccharide assembly protein LapB [Prevotella sp. KH2C16]|uniref:tetratricopeptide repeat protein n=1 Tax=Prevotella sp. KH2C16 TaxID=1855325 RepID=UPI0008E95D68|nr:tetratricopeptide repeat protein [Prevotella sp. KH2C16]SFG23070.1 Tetratricopeptide repeat-containing protein [Prevotella sp. KH2C16]